MGGGWFHECERWGLDVLVQLGGDGRWMGVLGLRHGIWVLRVVVGEGDGVLWHKEVGLSRVDSVLQLHHLSEMNMDKVPNLSLGALALLALIHAARANPLPQGITAAPPLCTQRHRSTASRPP